MKLTTKQLKQMIRESLEQVDYNNPRASFGPNDQENWENEQSAGTLDDSTQTVAALRNAIVRELDNHGRYIDRINGSKIDNLILQIFEMSSTTGETR